MTVTLDDGTTIVEEVAFPPGHDKNPLTDAQLAVKFHGLADPAIGRERAEQSASGSCGSTTTRCRTSRSARISA